MARKTAASATAHTGLITAKVTWGSNPDIDLHVLEPSSHVWSGNLNGNNGVLATTDSDGTGPEYYYSGCTLQKGKYKIKLNYVAGSTNESPVVTVTAGPYFYQTKLDLAVVGSSGNSSPPYGVCTIYVSRSGSSYKFKIIPNPLT